MSEVPNDSLVWFFNAFATSLFTWVPLVAEKKYTSEIDIEYEVGYVKTVLPLLRFLSGFLRRLVLAIGFVFGTGLALLLTLYVRRTCKLMSYANRSLF